MPFDLSQSGVPGGALLPGPEGAPWSAPTPKPDVGATAPLLPEEGSNSYLTKLLSYSPPVEKGSQKTPAMKAVKTLASQSPVVQMEVPGFAQKSPAWTPPNPVSSTAVAPSMHAQDYGKNPGDPLGMAVRRIGKRLLGNEKVQQIKGAVDLIHQADEGVAPTISALATIAGSSPEMRIASQVGLGALGAISGGLAGEVAPQGLQAAQEGLSTGNEYVDQGLQTVGSVATMLSPAGPAALAAGIVGTGVKVAAGQETTTAAAIETASMAGGMGVAGAASGLKAPLRYAANVLASEGMELGSSAAHGELPTVPAMVGAALTGVAFGAHAGKIHVNPEAPHAETKQLVVDAAQKYGVDPAIMLGLGESESGFKNVANAQGSGARGVFQFTRATAARYGVDRNDPASSADGATRYMRDLLKKHKGDVEAAIKEYKGFSVGGVDQAGVDRSLDLIKGYGDALPKADTPTEETQPEIPTEIPTSPQAEEIPQIEAPKPVESTPEVPVAEEQSVPEWAFRSEMQNVSPEIEPEKPIRTSLHSEAPEDFEHDVAVGGKLKGYEDAPVVQKETANNVWEGVVVPDAETARRVTGGFPIPHEDGFLVPLDYVSGKEKAITEPEVRVEAEVTEEIPADLNSAEATSVEAAPITSREDFHAFTDKLVESGNLTPEKQTAAHAIFDASIVDVSKSHGISEESAVAKMYPGGFHVGGEATKGSLFQMDESVGRLYDAIASGDKERVFSEYARIEDELIPMFKKAEYDLGATRDLIKERMALGGLNRVDARDTSLYQLFFDKYVGYGGTGELRNIKQTKMFKALAARYGADHVMSRLEAVRNMQDVIDERGTLKLNQGEKGSVSFDADNGATIRAFGSADVSTLAHEVSHVWRRWLPEADQKSLEKNFGVEGGKWEVAHEEKFARGFERYLADGHAPNPKMKKLFEQFKTWLTNIYKGIKGSAIDVHISPEMRQVFDRMMGGGQSMPEPVREPVVRPETKLSRAAAQIRDERRGSEAGVLYQRDFDPKSLREHIILTADDRASGQNDFDEWSKQSIDAFGEEIKPQLKSLWNRAGEIAAKDNPDITGMSHESINVERVLSELPPLVRREAVSDEAVWDKSRKLIEGNPNAGRNVIENFRKWGAAGLVPSAEMTPLIIHERVRAQRALESARLAIDALPIEDVVGRAKAQADLYEATDWANEVDLVAHRIGSEYGAGLAAQKWLALSDDEKYTFHRMERRMRDVAEKDAPLDAKEEAALKEGLAGREQAVAEVAKALDEKSQARFEEELPRHVESLIAERDTYQKLYAEVTSGDRSTVRGRRLAAQGRNDMAAAEARMLARRNTEVLFQREGEYIPFHPSHLSDVVEWASGKMRAGGKDGLTDALLEKFGPDIAPHLDKIVADAGELAVRKMGDLKRTSKKDAKAEVALNELEGGLNKKTAYDLVMAHIEDAIASGEKTSGREFTSRMVELAHADIKESFPNVSLREFRDMFSDFGKQKEPSPKENLRAMAETKRAMQLLSGIENAREGKPVPKSGVFGRHKPATDVRAMQRELDAKLNEMGIHAPDDTFIKSGLDRVKSALENQIQDLEKESGDIEEAIRSHEQMPKPEGKRGIEYDDEANRLKKERDTKKLVRDDLRKEHDRVFGVESRSLTDEERTNLAIKAAERGEAEYTRRLAEGDFASKQSTSAPLTDRLTEIRAARDAAKNAYESSQERQNIVKRTELARREAEINERIERGNKTGDYDRSRKEKPPIVVDIKTREAMANVERANRILESLIDAKRLKNRGTGEKIEDMIVKGGRFNKLLGVPILGKLFNAALTVHFVQNTGGEFIQMGLNRTPGVRRAMAKAETEGGASWETIKAGMTGFRQGVKIGAGLIRITRKADGKLGLQLRHTVVTMMGDKKKGVPMWMDIPNLTHEMIKAGPQEGAYWLSMAKQIAWADKNGVDWQDPLVNMRMQSIAVQKAQESIFQADNVFTQMWSSMMRTAGSYGASGKAVKAIGESIVPFVRPATNIPIMGMRAALGLPDMAIGLYKTARAFHNGIETLDPIEADIIARHLKYGLLGSSAMLLGFFSPLVFGGYSAGQKENDEREKRGLLKEGAVGSLPDWAAHILGHTHLAFAAQFGATLRHSLDDYVGNGSGLEDGLLAGVLGISKQMVFADAIQRAGDLLDPKGFYKYVAGVVSGQTVPGIVRNIAGWTDEPGIERQPGTFAERIEKDVPVLRQRVPIRPQSLVAKYRDEMPKEDRATVDDELHRLAMYLPAPDNKVNTGAGQEKLSDESYRTYVQEYVPIVYRELSKRIESRDYANAPDEMRKKEIEKVAQQIMHGGKGLPTDIGEKGLETKYQTELAGGEVKKEKPVPVPGINGTGRRLRGVRRHKEAEPRY